ncbi:MAG: 3-phosphoshikimate 1-carboxyvinyltransferase [Nitrososphaerota archaeon]|nr:3-phosphoshikimate 1-carboxyvinyltransferase [Candidatus Bathyarchaeota archaeon]MDW8048481.1 3-phosphoshikimate 1-carboxyvinyltransferase [Nitrososphaerota archaeon]
MADVIVKKTECLRGALRAPPSKSLTHRAFIAASLSDGLSTIEDPLICEDTLATIEACKMLGARIANDHENRFLVIGRAKPDTPENVINCRESASTIRFLTPVCALADGISILTGGPSLRKRPMKPILDALSRLGVPCYSARGDGYPPLIVFGGGIRGGATSLPGDISSQFVSGLLFATPLAKGQTQIIISSPLESKPYVSMTLDILKKHGVKVDADGKYEKFEIHAPQTYIPFNHKIEGDYSSAAFLFVAAAITGSDLKVENLRKDSLQGDRVIVDILQEIGVQIEVGDDHVRILGAEKRLKPLDINAEDHPDLVPPLVVLSSFIRGKSRIRGVTRLRYKESNRIVSLMDELSKMGVKMSLVDDSFVIFGDEKIRGAEVNSHGDHRIAMACIVAGLRAEGATIVHGAECINKSYPNFLRDLSSVGGEIIER